MVIGLAEVETGSGVLTPGADCGLRVGDVIEAANGRSVEIQPSISPPLSKILLPFSVDSVSNLCGFG